MDLQTCLKTSLRTKYQKLIDPPAGDSLLPPRFCCRDVSSFSDQHDFRHVDKSDFHTWAGFSPVLLGDLLSCDCRHRSSQRTVITVGVNGVGKTTAVQRCALDWAVNRDHHKIHLLFPLTFWELNLIKQKVSLMKLLQMFYPDLKEQLNARSLAGNNVWFVLDGLEDFSLPLNFSCPSVSDVSEASTVDVLVTSLIRGDLLHSAHVWVTTHSSAAARIPPCYFLKQAELQGFSDPQKEQRFRSIIGHEELVIKAIDHVKVSRSLDFLCEIPPICSIMANVLKKHLNPDDGYKITPLSLTQIYTKLIEASKSDILSKLKKLASLWLEKGNVMYKDDLLEADISAEEASAFSKECPLVLTEETGLKNTTVFRFGHSSIREFFAASAKLDTIVASQDSSLSESIQRLVNEAQESVEGKLDLLLRFTFGLVKERRLLEPTDGLFNHTKRKILENILCSSAVSLLHCLREYDSQAFLVQVRNYLKYGLTSGYEPMCWSFLCQRTRNFEGMRDTFELQVSMRCDEKLLRHLPIILKTRKVMLRFSNLTVKCCPALAAVLGTKESYLRVLDLGYNSIGDVGVRILVDELCSPNCRLKSLRLPGCGLTSHSCEDLASALLLSTTLRELDLSRNELGDDGMGKLSAGLSAPQCELETLRLSQCNIEHEGCGYLAEALEENHDYLKVLDLSINMIRDDGANKLCEYFGIWQLSQLEMYHCGLTAWSCRNIGKALEVRGCSLVELNLSNNKLEDAGIKSICEGFYSLGRLEKLNLTRCGITSYGCILLAKVLNQVSSVQSAEQLEYHGVELSELDLSKNCIGDKGVYALSAVLRNPYSSLRRLNLSRCSLTERCCADLAAGLALRDSPLWELDLSGNELKDKGVKKLCVGLRSCHCQLAKLALRSCSLTSKSIDILTSALKSNQHLVELHLMGNKIDDSDITALLELINNPKYALQTIDFPAD
ncbi:NACHT, LRR and PYD domains-containing protein 12-like [Parambassis ranga]|uniref:NACHT, LRR and PYD domains-containing protein 12-like n=1 Tax=Parambassis ranga TaxID=210632 RepID=A0A6P7HR15_9TELE|nr:NACHT, LRR and PYD domains-containing protein 12-like [Parambassis ranga]